MFLFNCGDILVQSQKCVSMSPLNQTIIKYIDYSTPSEFHHMAINL